MKFAVVITACAGREANLELVIDCLLKQRRTPDAIVVVDDGGELSDDCRQMLCEVGVELVPAAKHEPGLEQPRNIGTRVATSLMPDLTHVAFLDSDVVVQPEWLQEIQNAYGDRPDRVMVCPYDWLDDGVRPELLGWVPFWRRAEATDNDLRGPMFYASPPEMEYTNDLSAGLACFSGNLCWPVGEFQRVGGFWSEIHHGRCEDGELGLRAVAMGVPISFALKAAGWHLAHEVNTPLALERNVRDVPMLNARHPWVQGTDVFLVDRDGAAFDVHCRCGNAVPTLWWWQHAYECPQCGDLSISSLEKRADA